MVKTIDYYDYWNKRRTGKKLLLMREQKALHFISKISRPNSRLLDLGCGNGSFLLELKKRLPALDVKGIDFSKAEALEAKKQGLKVAQGDLEKGIDERNSSFDIVYAGEIIEHLYNPDLFLREINRVLKKDGFLILTTPNLCAWFNRILMPLGVQPLFIETSTKSKLVGAGFLSRFKKESQPVGHVRIFTLRAIRDMLNMHRFKVLDVKGADFQDGFPPKLLWIDRLFLPFPSLSSNLIILAKKM